QDITIIPITTTNNNTIPSITNPFSHLNYNTLHISNMDNSQNASYQAGQAKGQVQEKASGMMDKASNAAQSTKESIQETGSQMQAKAQGAAEATKESLGMNK
ncbi:hypothetical protein LINGRAHAP2_LOCUS26191, partial [Linum grandiflorum]